MIFLRQDGTMAFTFSNDVPPDCVQVNADGTAYTPPVISPAPVPPTLAEQQAQGWELAAVQARLRAHAAAVAAVVPAPATPPAKMYYSAVDLHAATARREFEAASERARLQSLAAAEAGKTAGEDLGGETYKLKR